MKRFNKYDLLIILTIATLAWGNNEALRFLYPIRILGAFGLFITASNWRLLSTIFRKWVIFLSLWLVYIVCSIVWTPEIGDGFIQAFHLVTIFGAMGMLMVASLKAKHPLNSIVLGWAAMVLITLPIAIWEIQTGQHLTSGNFHEDSMSYGQLRIFAAVTYGNFNSYSVALASALPFILTGWVDKDKNIFGKLFFIILTLLMAGILILNASRGCLLCLIVGVLLMLLMQMKGRFSLFNVALIIAIFAGAIYYAIVELELDMFFEITARLDNEGTELGRSAIYKAGLITAMKTGLVGGGVGSVEPLMREYTRWVGTYVTHNVFLEILIEYGLIICLVFIWKFYKTGFALWKSQDVKEKLIGYYVVITSVLLFLVDDYYTGESVFWIYLVSLIIISTLYTRRKREERNAIQQNAKGVALNR